jgi:hypothetical protein
VELEGEGEDAAVVDEEKTDEVEAMSQPPTSPPTLADIEQMITAKVIDRMRSDLVIERERRGLTPGSGGSVPL